MWKFTSGDITIVDDVPVVALNYLNNSLRNFILQDNAAIKQANKDRMLTCTTMKGYRDMIDRRAAAPGPPTFSRIQGSPPSTSAPRRGHFTRNALKASR